MLTATVTVISQFFLTADINQRRQWRLEHLPDCALVVIYDSSSRGIRTLAMRSCFQCMRAHICILFLPYSRGHRENQLHDVSSGFHRYVFHRITFTTYPSQSGVCLFLVLWFTGGHWYLFILSLHDVAMCDRVVLLKLSLTHQACLKQSKK